ncbi:MAG: peptide chain release factor N(5)-glutamine methyltransferase [Deltaproteobacteria bacterium]|nr:peptide chain release factor N(5)-glutamine methyltransferase [Deltaproteobacteria bacterium]
MALAVKKNWTIWETLLWAEDYLASYDVPDAKTEAEYLLAYVLDCKRMELHLNHASHLSYHILQEFINFVERRIKREPSQYILGEQEFWGLGFKVARDVLIPRPETELIIEETLKLPISHIPHLVILDLCAGSDCIAISLAKAMPDFKIYAADISEEALAVARENAERHGVADCC